MASPTPLTKANAIFSLDLLRKLSEDDNSANIFFSPFSISSALAMVMLGARGNTAMQMSECLNTRECQDDVHALFNQLLSGLNKSGGSFELSVANRLYGEQSFQFLQEFLTETRKHYDAELESVDFITSHQEARIRINNWVEKQTQGKIRDVVAEGVLNEMSRLVLVNAIYFKGTWNEPFLPYKTYDTDFKLNKNEKKKVKMMTQETHVPFAFIPEVNCQILEMPYKGKELSMLIFLPKDIEDDTTGLEKLEKQLTYEKFMEWTGELTVTQVNVSLPRFKLEETYDLNRVLTSMGMEDAFDEGKSDLSGMSGNKDLVLSKVTHKAFVEVNEEGTEAAAATSSFITLKCATMMPYFYADQPFLFFIRHNATMSVLFAGRFCCPV
ncbi:leukocyte elastase inhibitor-like isoform X2 [Cololabis saira]|nr:leukocyte elastase inhibitor-like isoform X2 [Cololabis saira]